MAKRKILIDCDTGTDDAIALVAALYDKNAEVVGLTAVNGNVALKYTARNTLNLARYLGFDDIPVAKGADTPLRPHSVHFGDGTHGATGLGCVTLPDTDKPFYGRSAVELIREQAEAAKGELEIVAVGPLTDIAIAFILYPEIKKLIKHLYIMGGAMVGGNMSPTAEFNIWVDPEAARYTFLSGVPITMVGLDVTTRAIMNADDSAAIRKVGTKAATVVADILDFMLDRFKKGGEDALMHDALALGSALCPECVKTHPYFVDVECEGTYTFGHTMVDRENMLHREPTAEVAYDLDLPAFKKWLYNNIKNSAE
jgi:pyrimidine-specific ribonucleoside hydrolase